MIANGLGFATSASKKVLAALQCCIVAESTSGHKGRVQVIKQHVVMYMKFWLSMDVMLMGKVAVP